MEKYIINGGRKLSGRVKIDSSKNAVLPLLAGAILTNDEVIIKNCPQITDLLNMIKILNVIGVKTQFSGSDLLINANGINSYTIPQELSSELRTSIYMMGALISRFKKANIYYPGGCKIGSRPIDLHIYGIKSLGVIVDEEDNFISCNAKNLKGNTVCLEYPSVGATVNIILASVMAKGITVIRNPAKEPEIQDLIDFLNEMGAKIVFVSGKYIQIEGVKKLHGVVYTPIPDRIETGTFLTAGAITGGEIEIFGGNIKNISILIHKFCDNACKIDIKNDIIYLKSGEVRKSFSFVTGPYPSFPTDMQAQAMALCCVSRGVSVITERVFENRFRHVSGLNGMGADITVKGRVATVNGVSRLHGAVVRAEDLRGGASLVLAGLSAEGITEVCDIKHIERGYSCFDKKLTALGADIKKVVK